MRRAWAMCVALGMLALASGCSGILRYADGPVLEYLQQPIPKPAAPLARTASLSIATWGGGAGFLYCDMLATPIGTVKRMPLPKRFEEEMYAALKLDDRYSDGSTLEGFNMITDIGHRGRRLKRELRRAKRHEEVPGSAAQAEALAVVAWDAGEPTVGHAYASAAKMRWKAEKGRKTVRPTAGRVMEHATGGFDILNEEYRRAWEWLQGSSGAIGPGAPEGSHLNAFVLDVFDAEPFQLDSRSRVAVLLILVHADGTTTSVLRGSDFLVCKDECTSVQQKPSMQPMELDDVHEDVKAELFSGDGFKKLSNNGFYQPNGGWQYLIVQHALADLARAAAGDVDPDPRPASEDTPAPAAADTCAPVDPSTLPQPPAPSQAWAVAAGRVVCVVKADGSVVHGELVAADDETASIVADGGQVVVVPKADVAEIRLEP